MLNKKALETANEILQINSKHAKWIASDAIRDLTNPATLNRVDNVIKEFDKNFDNVCCCASIVWRKLPNPIVAKSVLIMLHSIF